jgi:hypothetical protein
MLGRWDRIDVEKVRVIHKAADCTPQQIIGLRGRIGGLDRSLRHAT